MCRSLWLFVRISLAATSLLTANITLASPERVDQLIKATLQLDPNVERGGTLYREHCQACHGADAMGDASKLIPALAAQRRAYLIKQLADFAELERTATQMHAVVARTQVDEPQAWADLTAYLNGLKVTSLPQVGNAEMLSLGEASYEQWCASCHGEDGRGDDDGFVPSVRNQHYAYLLHQMRQLSRGHRFNVESDLVLFLDSLDTGEMVGLADYISRLHVPVRERARMRNDGYVGD